MRVEGQLIGAIEAGLVAMIGIVRDDTAVSAERLLQRLLEYRVFADSAGRMNISLRQIHGGLLLIPQFTLAADTTSGNRPGFSLAAEPAQAASLFQHLLSQAHSAHTNVAAGRFGAHMQVSLINDGPVTFWLESGERAAPGALKGYPRGRRR